MQPLFSGIAALAYFSAPPYMPPVLIPPQKHERLFFLERRQPHVFPGSHLRTASGTPQLCGCPCSPRRGSSQRNV